MKFGILATIVAAIMSLFGGHQIAGNTVSYTAASAAPTAPIASVETAPTSPPLTIAASSTAPTTIIQQPVLERIIERVVPQQSGGDTVSPATLKELIRTLWRFDC